MGNTKSFERYEYYFSPLESRHIIDFWLLGKGNIPANRYEQSGEVPEQDVDGRWVPARIMSNYKWGSLKRELGFSGKKYFSISEIKEMVEYLESPSNYDPEKFELLVNHYLADNCEVKGLELISYLEKDYKKFHKLKGAEALSFRISEEAVVNWVRTLSCKNELGLVLDYSRNRKFTKVELKAWVEVARGKNKKRLEGLEVKGNLKTKETSKKSLSTNNLKVNKSEEKGRITGVLKSIEAEGLFYYLEELVKTLSKKELIVGEDINGKKLVSLYSLFKLAVPLTAKSKMNRGLKLLAIWDKPREERVKYKSVTSALNLLNKTYSIDNKSKVGDYLVDYKTAAILLLIGNSKSSRSLAFIEFDIFSVKPILMRLADIAEKSLPEILGI